MAPPPNEEMWGRGHFRFCNAPRPVYSVLRATSGSPRSFSGLPSDVRSLCSLRIREREHDRRVVARAVLSEHGTRGHSRHELTIREDVVDAPSDVTLTHVAPWSPPGEQSFVVWMKSAG